MKNEEVNWRVIISIFVILYASFLIIGLVYESYKFSQIYNLRDGSSKERYDEIVSDFWQRGMEYEGKTIFQILLVFYLLLIIIELFIIYLGYKLWRRKNWARIVLIIFSYFYSYYSVIGILTREPWAWAQFLISMAIALHLNFNKKLKSEFDKEGNALKKRNRKKK